jgi:hypothetical protein
MPNVISSPGSPDGLTPCNSPASLQISLFGQEAALVNRFRAQEKEGGRKTSGTCGLHGSASSRSADLQLFLENRLRQRMDVNGSVEYALTWSHWGMRLGLPICALRASAHRTSGNDCSGRQGWPTPIQNDAEKRGVPKVGAGLAGEVFNAGWQTPHTPRQHDSDNSESTYLGRQVQAISGWVTPTQRDWKSEQGGEKTIAHHKKHSPQLSAQALGATPDQSSAATEKHEGYRLNPRFSLWLQGYPIEWAHCAEQATPSSRKLPPNSSKP